MLCGFRNVWLTALASCAAIAVPAAASATTLAAGYNLISGATVAEQPQLAGTVVEDELTNVSFAVGSGAFSAKVQSRVVLSVDGTYDFYWRVFDTAFTGREAAAIGSFRIGDFGVPIVGLNGGYALDGLGDLGPNSVSVLTPPSYQFANFNFESGLQPGQDSYFMFLDTDAVRYGRTAVFDLTNVGQTQISTAFSTFGASQAVPEPSTWALMIGGFGLAGGALRRRRAMVTA